MFQYLAERLNPPEGTSKPAAVVVLVLDEDGRYTNTLFGEMKVTTLYWCGGVLQRWAVENDE